VRKLLISIMSLRGVAPQAPRRSNLQLLDFFYPSWRLLREKTPSQRHIELEYFMKRLIFVVFAILAALTTVIDVRAQTSESIWLTANTTAYKTGETVTVALNASSTTPIQGFTFQIRYDPSCLRPVHASSPISGMNGLPVPQLSGMVDGSYASTTPLTVSGILAEVKFTALKGCQTDLTLESAALATRNAEGFAAPVSGVVIAQSTLSLNIDREAIQAQSTQVAPSGSILPLTPPNAGPTLPPWMMILLAILAALMLLATFRRFRRGASLKRTASRPSSRAWKAALQIKHGPHAGKSFSLNKLPTLIGRDPQNDIYIDDPHVIDRHAQIYAERNAYYLRDLGGGTFINGQPVKSSTAVLHPGDVVRLGKSVLFVFR
jgi:hypothetical protein